LKLGVLTTAVLQPVIASTSFGSSSKLMDQASDPIITPAGYAFTIWGAITIGSLIYAFYQLRPQKKTSKLYEDIAPYSVVVFAGFSAWLYAASHNWLLVTIGIFLLMGFCLFKIYSEILQTRSKTKFTWVEQIGTYGTFSLYTGWTTVAIFANIASAVKFSGFSDVGTSGIFWQVVVLLLATAASMLAIRYFKASVLYTLTILWALIAVLVGTLQHKTVAGILPLIISAAILSIIGTFLKYRLAKN